jgi:prepilin-type processing-associated H-X9-DG protein
MTTASRRHTLPIGVADLVPHREPMLILQELQECTEDYARGVMTAQSRNPYITQDGLLEAAAFPELIAQLYAAWSGYLSRNEASPPQSGYLVGVSDFRIAREACLGDELMVEVRNGQQIANVAMVDGHVAIGRDRAAEGRIKLYLESSLERSVHIPVSAAPERNFTSRAVQEAIREHLHVQRGNLSAELSFPEGSPVFSGHFPGHPVVPGAVWIAAARVLSEELAGRSQKIRRIEWAKFKSPVLPGEHVRLDVEFPGRDARLARLARNGSPVASMLLHTGDAG